eukprot:scpid55025/ scgid3037/ Fibrillin-1
MVGVRGASGFLLLLLFVLVTSLGNNAVNAQGLSAEESTGKAPNRSQADAGSVQNTTVGGSCLAQWLLLAGAGQKEAQRLSKSSPIVEVGLDERMISRFSHFVLSLLLGFNDELASKLKDCVDRNSTCPAVAQVEEAMNWPCGQTGTCLFNRTLQSTTCDCPLGLSGDQCEHDIDECKVTSMNNCGEPSTATCNNTFGSFLCSCRLGYYGNGQVCKDVDECTVESEPCDQHANCSNSVGYYTCTCDIGYSGDGHSCEDLNECAVDALNTCANSTFALCYNIMGSYVCECRPGFTGNGRICQDVDECNVGSEERICGEHANCTNTLGSYRCVCDRGYTGDGQRCEEDSCAIDSNSPLCREVKQLKRNVESLEKKLGTRDKKVDQLLREMRAMSSVFTTYHVQISEMARRVRHTETLLSAQTKVITAKTKVLTAKTEVLTAKTDIISADLNNTKDRLSVTESNCGLVAWKTFRQTTGGSIRASWNVMYNKTRSDTVLRVTYTSAFGSRRTTTWNSFTISILINNTDCQDPGPIRSGVSSRATGSSSDYRVPSVSLNVYNILPGAVSGVCHINTAGPLRITTKLARNSGRTMYEGYYQYSAHRITSSLHVEEMCHNGIE